MSREKRLPKSLYALFFCTAIIKRQGFQSMGTIKWEIFVVDLFLCTKQLLYILPDLIFHIIYINIHFIIYSISYKASFWFYKIYCYIELLVTRPDSSDLLRRSHVTQCPWGYCVLEYYWGYAAATVTGVPCMQ